VPRRFTNFTEFYPVYLRMHDHPINRALHVVGNLLSLAALVIAVAAQSWPFLLAVPVIGNGFAWVGHFRFQRNRPGVFTYPLYGFLGSWAMTGDILRGKLRIKSTAGQSGRAS
jgi:hypothetical protein